MAAEGARVQDDEPTVEQLPDLDAKAGIRAGAAQLPPALAEGDGVVARHDPRIGTAHAEGQILGRAAPHGVGAAGGLAEAAIEVGDDGEQIGLGGGHGGDPTQAQIARQAVLQGGPPPFDPALGLRRVGAAAPPRSKRRLSRRT